jgi:hypothetical protein
MPQLTTSARGVILQGQLSTVVNLTVPGCSRGEDFLVKGVHVGPEVSVGNTNVEVVQLPRWAVEVPLYQTAAGGKRNCSSRSLAWSKALSTSPSGCRRGRVCSPPSRRRSG